MHTVELLEQAIALAGQLGFVVRQEWLNGSAAGACEFNGRRWIFLDLAQSPRELLDQVLVTLNAYPKTVSERGTVPFCSEDCAKSGQSPPVLG